MGHSRSFALLVYQGAITDRTRRQLFHSGTFLAWCRGRCWSANLWHAAAEWSQEEFRSHTVLEKHGARDRETENTPNLLRILYLHTTRKNSMRQAFFATLWWAFTIHERIYLVPFPVFFFGAQAYTGDKEMEPLFCKILQVWLATGFAWIHEQNVIKLQLLMANAFAEVFQDGCRWSQYPPRHARDPQVGDFSAWLSCVDSRDPVQLFPDKVVTCDIVWPRQNFTHHYHIYIISYIIICIHHIPLSCITFAYVIYNIILFHFLSHHITPYEFILFHIISYHCQPGNQYYLCAVSVAWCKAVRQSMEGLIVLLFQTETTFTEMTYCKGSGPVSQEGVIKVVQDISHYFTYSFVSNGWIFWSSDTWFSIAVFD